MQEEQEQEQKEESLSDTLLTAYESLESADGDQTTSQVEDVGKPEGEVRDETTKDSDLEPILAPQSWQKEAKDVFKRLPRDLQEQVAKRAREQDGDYTRKTQELASQRNRYAELEEVLAPYQERLALNGKTAGQVVKQLLVAQDRLNKQPKETLRWMLDQYGLSPEDLTKVESGPKQDPQIARLENQIRELQGREQERVRAQQGQYQQHIVAEVNSFAAEKDETGNLRHPHIERILPDFRANIIFLKQQAPNRPHREILSEAYQRAIWSNPETREAQLSKGAQDRAKKAKVAGSSISGAPSGSVAKDMPTDLRQLLETVYSDRIGQ